MHVTRWLVALVLTLDSGALEAAEVARVTRLHGEAKAAAPLALGDSLEAGERLSLGADSLVRLTFEPAGVLSLGAGTRLSLGAGALDLEAGRLELVLPVGGAAPVRVTTLAGAFLLSAGVVRVEVGAGGRTVLAVLRGSALVEAGEPTGGGPRLELAAGQTLILDERGAPTPLSFDATAWDFTPAPEDAHFVVPDAATPGAVRPAEPLPFAADFVVLPQVPRFDGRVGLTFGDDSNPHLLSDELSLRDPEGSLLRGPQGDRYLQGHARFAFQPLRRPQGPTLGIVGEVAQAAYQDFGYLDLGELRATLNLFWGADPLGYTNGPLGYQRVPLGWRRVSVLVQAGAVREFRDGESFGDGIEAAVVVTVQEGGRAALAIEGFYRDFDTEPARRNFFDLTGTRSEVTLRQTLYGRSRNRYIRLGLMAGEQDGTGLALDASRVALSFDGAFPLGRRVTLFASAEGAREEFDDDRSNIFRPGLGPPREDDVTAFGLGASFRLAPRLYALIRAAHHERDVDLGAGGIFSLDLGYDRQLYSVGITWMFEGGGEP